MVLSALALVCSLLPKRPVEEKFAPAFDTQGVMPILPPSWLVRDWYLNGSTGSDTSNSGQSSGSPLQTWHKLHDQIWDCWGAPGECPRWQQGGTVTIHINGSLAASDVVYLHAAAENGTVLVVQSDTLGTNIGSGTLSGYSALNRTTTGKTVTYSITGIGGSLPPGTLIQNTTRNTFAWSAISTSSVSPWNSTPFMTSQTVPFTSQTQHPNISNASTNGDSIIAWTPFNFTLGEFNITNESWGDGGQSNQNPLYVYDLTVGDGTTVAGIPNRTGYVDGHVSFVQCAEQYPITISSSKSLSARSGFYNSFNIGGIYGGKSASPDVDDANDLVIYGGALGASSLDGTATGLVLDGDVVMMGSARIRSGSIGAMNVQPNLDMQIEGTVVFESFDYTNVNLYSFADGGASNTFPAVNAVGHAAIETTNATWASTLLHISPEINQLHLAQPAFCAIAGLDGGTVTGTWQCGLGPVTPAALDDAGGIQLIGGGSWVVPTYGP